MECLFGERSNSVVFASFMSAGSIKAQEWPVAQANRFLAQDSQAAAVERADHWIPNQPQDMFLLLLCLINYS